MKKILTILVIVLAGYSALYWLALKDKIVNEEVVLNENEEAKTEDILVTENEAGSEEILNGKFCFDRTQVATDEAPYSAEEYIEININETKR